MNDLEMLMESSMTFDRAIVLNRLEAVRTQWSQYEQHLCDLHRPVRRMSLPPAATDLQKLLMHLLINHNGATSAASPWSRPGCCTKRASPFCATTGFLHEL